MWHSDLVLALLGSAQPPMAGPVEAAFAEITAGIEQRDPFLLLGIHLPQTPLDQTQVDRAFRARSRLTHPDRHCAQPSSAACRSATQLYPAISEAHTHPASDSSFWRVSPKGDTVSPHQTGDEREVAAACCCALLLVAVLCALAYALVQARQVPQQRPVYLGGGWWQIGKKLRYASRRVGGEHEQLPQSAHARTCGR